LLVLGRGRGETSDNAYRFLLAQGKKCEQTDASNLGKDLTKAGKISRPGRGSVLYGAARDRKRRERKKKKKKKKKGNLYV